MAPSQKKPKRAYRSAKRARGRERTREKIVAAAECLLHERGWEKFSVEAVARTAGVTRLTVYNQFGDRRALLEAVFDEHAARGGLQEIASAMQLDDPRAALCRVIEIFCAFWARSGPIQGVMAAAMADSELARAIHERNERRRELLGVIVGAMVKRGEVTRRSGDRLVDTLFALTSFAFYRELSASRLGSKGACAVVAELVSASVERCRPAAGSSSR